MKFATPNTPPGGDRPRTYEVQEFIRLRNDGGLLPVRHYRTVYGHDGMVAVETLSVRPLLTQAVAAFGGRVAADGETVIGHFDGEAEARACAAAIARHHGQPVTVAGTQVTIFGVAPEPA